MTGHIRSKRKGGHAEEGEGWLMSYADLMTLLLCVFVLLFSMSSLDSEKTKAVSQAMSKYLHSKETANSEVTDVTATERKLEAFRLLAQYLELGHPDDVLANLLKMGDRPEEIENLKETAQKLGIVTSSAPQAPVQKYDLVLPTKAVFATGTANLTSEGLSNILRLAPKINEALKDPLRSLEIAGHTDSSALPAQSQFSSNHMLSAAQAEAVSLALIKGGVKPQRIRIIGKGSTEPLFPEALDSKQPDAVAQAKNRRVVISVVTFQRQ
jgi:chemotaxis protein MotB